MAIDVVIIEEGEVVGFQASKYEIWNRDILSEDIQNKEATGEAKDIEWSGFYLARDRTLAEGYREATNEGVVSYIQTFVATKEIRLLRSDDPSAGIPTTGSGVKANNFRQAADGEYDLEEGSLTIALGKAGYMYMGVHDEEGNYEVCVPGALLDSIEMSTSEKYISNKYLEWEEVADDVEEVV